LLRQEARSAFGYLASEPNLVGPAAPSADEARAAALDAAGVPVSPPGLAAFQPQDAQQFCRRQQLTALLVAGAQLTRIFAGHWTRTVAAAVVPPCTGSAVLCVLSACWSLLRRGLRHNR
jgi:hypothetical protein